MTECKQRTHKSKLDQRKGQTVDWTLRSEQKIISALLIWYSEHGRHDLPWRKTRNPYNVLVSELMLQQTQVSRVIPKYHEFLTAFPSLRALAKADRSQVLRLWQGLGYNSRAVRLHALAKVLNDQGKELPQSRDELLALPGIGPYTSGAIMIFAHDTPALSVDVNVARVLKRVFWSPAAVPKRNDIDDLALHLSSVSKYPHDWQSALMDIGSQHCTARTPRCTDCPLRSSCKTKGVRPDELRTTQSTFLGSRRWWRGQILKQLLSGPAQENRLIYKIKELPNAEDEDLFAAALAAMMKEGIVGRRQARVYLL